MKRLFFAVGLLVLSGCMFTRTVYVPAGKAVRLRETLKSVRVWVKLPDGKTAAGKLDLSEGWYVLPAEPEE